MEPNWITHDVSYVCMHVIDLVISKITRIHREWDERVKTDSWKTR